MSRPHFQCHQVKRTFRPQRSFGLCPGASDSQCDLARTGPVPFTARCPLTIPARPLKRIDNPQEGADFAPLLSSCAIVASGGSLLGTRCGADIDDHEAVVRINSPIINATFAPDVGWKTTLHAVNQELTEDLSRVPTPTEFVSEDNPRDRRPFLTHADLISFAEDRAKILRLARATTRVRSALG
eukprot:862152-Prymnesium_polylepis.1